MSDGDGLNKPIAPELVAVLDFLSQSLPFHELDQHLLQRAAGAIKVCYHRHGDVFEASGEPAGLRILRSGAVDIRDSDNKLLDRLGEGESFHIGDLNAERGNVQARVIEDALLYLLPDQAYSELRNLNRTFDRYFSSQRNRRLRRAARYEPDPSTMLREVRTIMSTQLLIVDLDMTVQEAALAMTERRVSSAIIMDGEQLAGIITDRDLRVRCTSKALSPNTAVVKVMTPQPLCIDAGTNLFEATLLMTRNSFHHLPVTDENKLVGVITASDLMLARQDDPVYLVQHISRQDSPEGISQILEGMPNLMVHWVQSGVRAQQVSRILTAISDAATVRLIQLGEQAFGPAPVPWCWVGFGSQARAEQLLGADQDNGMIISNELQSGQVSWFEAMAGFVCDGLAACGFHYCPGEIMATTPKWRVTLAQWQETVRRWTRSPTPDAVLRVSIFFDLRPVYGDSDLCDQLQQLMLDQASKNTIFQAALAANVLDNSPPLGIFRRFVVDRDGEHRDALDLKKRGVLLVTEIVRLHALAADLPQTNTSDRLAALADSGALTLLDSRNLEDALNFVQQLRMRNQCEQLLSGETVSNFILPGKLPKMAKEQLRDAFTIIDEAQSAVRLRYRAGMG